MTVDGQTIRARFQECREQDLRATPERRFLCRWEITRELHCWTGISDILRWISHIEIQSADLAHTSWTLPYGAPELSLVERSAAFNNVVFKELFGKQQVLHRNLDFYNMTDWVLQHAYPRPVDDRLERILDFGAGFGRQAALWLTSEKPTTYVAMDAVELPYVAQTHYLSNSKFPLVEYLDDPGHFRIAEDGATARAFHLPAWRYDLLPSDFFDMIACVQVLPEIREDVLFHSLGLFRRILRPGGYLYIRDQAPQDTWRPGAWMPGHAQIVPALLPSFGFRCEFAPQWRDGNDVHGLPQVWRRVDGPCPTPPTVRHRLKAVQRLIRRVRYSRYATSSGYTVRPFRGGGIDIRATRAPR